MQRFATTVATIAAGFACFAAAALRADEIWRNDWLFSAPPTFGFVSERTPRQAAFAADGDIVLATSVYSFEEFQFVRLGPDGSLRWTANAGWYGPTAYGANALIATDDGGALVAFSVANIGYPDYTARIDAAGEFVWMREVPSEAIVQDGLGHVVTIGCDGLTQLDAATGDVIWKADDATNFACGAGGVITDGEGNVYSIANESNAWHIVKYAQATGTPVWDVPTGGSSNGFATLVGVGGSLAYALGETGLIALRVADGSLAWSGGSAVSGGAVVAGSPPEAIISDGQSITRYAAATGTPRWTVPLANTGKLAVAGDSLLAMTSSQKVARVALADGSVRWDAPLPSHDGFGNTLSYANVGALDGSTLAAVGGAVGYSPAPIFIGRLAFGDGAAEPAIDVPEVTQADDAGSILDPSGRIFAVQGTWNATSWVVRVRSLDAASGAERWRTESTPDLTSIDPDMPTNFGLDIAATPTATIVDVAASVGDFYGGLWLALYDSATGVERWNTVIRDDDQLSTSAWTPAADASGDVYVSLWTGVPCSFGGWDECARDTLRKVSAADGHVVWRFAMDAPDPTSYRVPLPFALAGDEPILAGPFSGAFAADSVIALSGADGSTRWTSDVLGAGAVSNLFPTDGGVIVVGAGWAKLDIANGNVLWQGSVFAQPCDAFVLCMNYDSVKLANDDVVMAGEANGHPMLTLLRGDGSGAYENWELPPNAPTIRSVTTTVRSDRDGRLWVALVRQARPSGAGLTELAEIDPSTGAILSQQALRALLVDPMQANDQPAFLAAPEQNRLLLDVLTVAPPASTLSGDALVDTTITAHGDLVASLDVDPPIAHGGQPVGFHAHLTYTGDAPVAGVQFNVYLPWSTGARDVVCSGVPACTLDTRGGNVLATIDLESGSSVDIRGTTMAIDQRYVESATFGAVAVGPIGLDESDTLDNIAQSTISQGIFADGFDGR